MTIPDGDDVVVGRRADRRSLIFGDVADLVGRPPAKISPLLLDPSTLRAASKSDDRNSDNNYNEQTLTSSNRKPENKNKLLETIELTFTKKPVSYTYNFKEKQKKYQNSTLKGTN